MLRFINTANSVIFHMCSKIKQKKYGFRNLMIKCKHTVVIITPISSILPGVSWRSGNWIATRWYMGVTFLGDLPDSSGVMPFRLDSAVDCLVSLESGCMPYPDAAQSSLNTFCGTLFSTVPSCSKTPPLQIESQKFSF